ncbi:hypothetical protein U1Q18_042142 [Sarracenia purpurea var. burkii]
MQLEQRQLVLGLVQPAVEVQGQLVQKHEQGQLVQLRQEQLVLALEGCLHLFVVAGRILLEAGYPVQPWA